MKKPEYRELKEDEYTKEDYVDKIIKEQHFCPVCDKPTAIYYQEFYKDGGEGTADINVDNAWWWIDGKNAKFEIVYVAMEDNGDEGCIFFTPKEVGLKIKSIDNTIQDLYDEYIKKYDIKNNNTPYFCSKKCAKKYILSELKKVTG